jgi:hypothetical protein
MLSQSTKGDVDGSRFRYCRCNEELRTMNNEDAKKLVKDVFYSIVRAESIEDLSEIVKREPILFKNRFDPSKYPDLTVSLSTEEINSLKSTGILSEENKIQAVKKLTTFTALEKLLYSLLWKNGDLGKEVHIVEGVLSIEEEEDASKKTGLVFYQFGRHLARREEPIVDQHTIRAFLIFSNLNSGDSEITRIRKRETLEREDLHAFKAWISSLSKSRVEIQFHIDKVLFSLGKSIKISKKKT